LREGDDLHARLAAMALARRQHPVEFGKPAFEIDVDMGAQVRGAMRHAFADQIAGAILGGDRQIRQDLLVGIDAAHPCRPRRLPHPGQAHQRLVEMHVAINETRQHQIASDIEGRDAVRQRRGDIAERNDTPTGDPDIGEATIGQPAMAQECVERRHGAVLLQKSSASARRRNRRASAQLPGTSRSSRGPYC